MKKRKFDLNTILHLEGILTKQSSIRKRHSPKHLYFEKLMKLFHEDGNTDELLKEKIRIMELKKKYLNDSL